MLLLLVIVERIVPGKILLRMLQPKKDEIRRRKMNLPNSVRNSERPSMKLMKLNERKLRIVLRNIRKLRKLRGEWRGLSSIWRSIPLLNYSISIFAMSSWMISLDLSPRTSAL